MKEKIAKVKEASEKQATTGEKIYSAHATTQPDVNAAVAELTKTLKQDMEKKTQQSTAAAVMHEVNKSVNEDKAEQKEKMVAHVVLAQAKPGRPAHAREDEEFEK